MYYPDDFYNEPSEFDMQVEEFKESLAKSVKSEFLEEMERLKAENKNLKGIKEHFEQIKRDYERKKSECDRAMREAENKAKRMKAEELMKKFKTFLWRPDWEYLYGPKCDKCDENRNIKITLPSGREVNDDCECDKSKMKVMVPERLVRYELADRDPGIVAWYTACGKEGERYYKLDYASTVYAEGNIVEPGTSFDVLEAREDQRDILFTTREECLAYCEYLNEKNLVPTDAIYKRNGEVWKSEEE
nr:hypothetical protein [uncultured Acetatifactor sp.]